MVNNFKILWITARLLKKAPGLPIKQNTARMASAGYSGTPLLKKLGLEEGLKIRLVNPPEDYFELLEMDVSGQLAGAKEMPDWVHLFARSRREFEKGMEALKKTYKKNRGWLSYYF